MKQWHTVEHNAAIVRLGLNLWEGDAGCHLDSSLCSWSLSLHLEGVVLENPSSHPGDALAFEAPEVQGASKA